MRSGVPRSPLPAHAREYPPRMARTACLGLAMLAALQPAWATASDVPTPHAPSIGSVAAITALSPGIATAAAHADPLRPYVSAQVEHVALWINASGDNGRLPYIIVDKVNARVFVFNRDGHLQGVEPALLGMAVGDRMRGPVSDQALPGIRPEDRITPAGRFVASLDRDLKGQSILWLDYDNSLALHRVVKGTPREHRAERLQTATVSDNRISYGCINVPVMFFDKILAPVFTNTSGIVYILPETTTAQKVFGSYEANARAP